MQEREARRAGYNPAELSTGVREIDGASPRRTHTAPWTSLDEPETELEKAGLDGELEGGGGSGALEHYYEDTHLIASLLSESGEGAPASAEGSDAIAAANALALQQPTADAMEGATMVFTYLPNDVYQILTAPLNVTRLELEPGERLTTVPKAGDTGLWLLSIGESVSGGLKQQHIFLKSLMRGAKTNLVLSTNRRTYHLLFESTEGAPLQAARWTYPPQTEAFFAPDLEGEPEPEPALPTTDIADVNTDYTIRVKSGAPSWVPTTVYDNGRQTFIRFDKSTLHSETPVLHVVERGQLELVDYRTHLTADGPVYVVYRLFRLAELRLGQKRQDVVSIRRNP